MTFDSTISISDICLLIQLVVVSTGVVFAVNQFLLQKRESKARTLLGLREQFMKHQTLIATFRQNDIKLSMKFTNEFWAEIEDLLSLFEQCEQLIKYGFINSEVFSSSYKVILENLINNSQVWEKLKNERFYWIDLLDLVKRMNIEVNNL